MPDTPNLQAQTIRIIRETVCAELSIPFSLLQQKSRRTELVQARHIMMRMLKRYTALTLSEIGKQFKREDSKGLDHTTVIHGLASLQDAIDTEDYTRDLVTKIEFEIRRVIPQTR